MAIGPIESFGLVFAVIALAEVFDRTNFALIGLASRYPPSHVWAGATAAFVVTTVLSVVVGAALVTALGPHIAYLRLGGGVFLVGYAAYLALVPEEDRRIPAGKTAASSAFILILLLELGDTTMILTILFVSEIPSALVVGLAATLGLATVAASACLIGGRLGAKVEPRLLDRVVIVILVVVGVATILYAIDPSIFASVFG